MENWLWDITLRAAVQHSYQYPKHVAKMCAHKSYHASCHLFRSKNWATGMFKCLKKKAHLNAGRSQEHICSWINITVRMQIIALAWIWRARSNNAKIPSHFPSWSQFIFTSLKLFALIFSLESGKMEHAHFSPSLGWNGVFLKLLSVRLVLQGGPTVFKRHWNYETCHLFVLFLEANGKTSLSFPTQRRFVREGEKVENVTSKRKFLHPKSRWIKVGVCCRAGSDFKVKESIKTLNEEEET